MKSFSVLFAALLVSLAGDSYADEQEGDWISAKYIAKDYQLVRIIDSSGQVFLDRKLVQGQGLSLPYRNAAGKKIKVFTVVTDTEQLTLKPTCSKKQSSLALAKGLFELAGTAKKPPCIVGRVKRPEREQVQEPVKQPKVLSAQHLQHAPINPGIDEAN